MTMNSSDQFEAIVSEHYEPLFRFAMSLTRVESDAWDLTQQTFLVWARKGHQLRDISKVKSWLFTTLHRAFIEGRRRQVRFPCVDWEEVSPTLPAASPAVADQLDSSEVLPALGKVDDVYQAAVALFYLEDCSYKEIAVILGVPIGTVKSRIARGIEQLRENLLSDGYRASSPPQNGSCQPSHSDECAPESEHIVPNPPCPTRLAAGSPGSSYAEWDFSSAFLLEPIALG